MAYDESIKMETTKVEKVRGRDKTIKFVNWIFVASAELEHASVNIKEDELGVFFVCDTSEYLPAWLRTTTTANVCIANAIHVNANNDADNCRSVENEGARNDLLYQRIAMLRGRTANDAHENVSSAEKDANNQSI